MNRLQTIRAGLRLASLVALVALGCQPPPAVVTDSSPDVVADTAPDSTSTQVPAQELADTLVQATDQMSVPVIMGNPPAPGFDLAGSDRRAIEIADRVMSRLGGRAAWEQSRYLTWRFFGKRRHVWDKWTGDLRFEQADLVVLMNLHQKDGQAWRSGEAVEQPDSLAAHLAAAYRAWINDSYWLVMPYKLKDSGVTLTYVGQEMTEEGLPAHVLELRSKEVGVTPQNRYRVWVDIHESLVRQWSFYREAGDSEPRFVLPWQGWKSYGRIWLAHDFGRSRHSEIGVLDHLPASVFSDPAPVSIPTGQ